MSTRWQRIASQRADHVLHVRSAARAQEAQCSHRTVSWTASSQERLEDCCSLSPATFEECDAPTRDHYFFALSRWILADQHRQLCQHLISNNTTCLCGDGLQVGSSIRSGVEPRPGCHLAWVAAQKSRSTDRAALRGTCSRSHILVRCTADRLSKPLDERPISNPLSF